MLLKFVKTVAEQIDYPVATGSGIFDFYCEVRQQILRCEVFVCQAESSVEYISGRRGCNEVLMKWMVDEVNCGWREMKKVLVASLVTATRYSQMVWSAHREVGSELIEYPILSNIVYRDFELQEYDC